MSTDKETHQLKVDIANTHVNMGTALYMDLAQSLVPIITASIGVAGIAIKGLQVWLEERKSRKIKIRKGDVEIELNGKLSDEEIYQKLEIFNNFQDRQTYKDLLKMDIKVMDNDSSTSVDIQKEIIKQYQSAIDHLDNEKP